jgi:tetratricopeptide (TPR) repeat protein
MYETLGQVEQAQADFSRAIEAFSAVIESDRSEAIGYYNRAAVLVHIGEYDRALADYAAMTQLNDDDALPHMRRGFIFFRRSEYASALVEYIAAAELLPENADYLAAACAARTAAGIELNLALAACEEALRLSEGARGLFARAFLRFMQGEFESAWTDFAAAAELDADNAFALHGRGGARFALDAKLRVRLTLPVPPNSNRDTQTITSLFKITSTPVCVPDA